MRGALESFDRTSSVGKRERSAQAARPFFCPEPQQPRRTVTLFCSRLYDSLAGLSFLTVFRSKKGFYVTASSSNPWERSRCGVGQRLLGRCSRSLATFLCDSGRCSRGNSRHPSALPPAVSVVASEQVQNLTPIESYSESPRNKVARPGTLHHEIS